MTRSDSADAIVVGIADYAVTDQPAVLKTSGLGSCIGVAIHDEAAGVSGLLHVMLPDSSETTGDDADAKFADTGVQTLLTEVGDRGGDPSRSWAKIAGGASMVAFENADRSATVTSPQCAAHSRRTTSPSSRRTSAAISAAPSSSIRRRGR